MNIPPSFWKEIVNFACVVLSNLFDLRIREEEVLFDVIIIFIKYFFKVWKKKSYIEGIVSKRTFFGTNFERTL